MAKTKMAYLCDECGHEQIKWSGQCPNCGEWNTMSQYVPEIKTTTTGVAVKVKSVNDLDFSDDIRLDTGTGELNRVLGGGIVLGSMILISGDPGIGKSTLLLQICGTLGKNRKVLYISGEESEKQIKLRANRLNVKAEKLFLAGTTDCGAVAATILQEKPDVVVIDSIQTMALNEVGSLPGSITQVRECTNVFLKIAKTYDIPIFLVGHVNKDGGVAGPKVLEHIVDTVLYFEGEVQSSYRILRAVKNRYGSTNEIGVFEMRDKGLFEVENPSLSLLSGRPAGVSGISILCTMEGSRPILAEVQALVTKTAFGQGRRTSNGFDYNRLNLIIAVMEKRTGFLFGMFDVYINVIGGLKIDEPAADAAIALALYSGLLDKVLPDDVIVIGEIGLGGEIRNVGNIPERIKESARLGFKKVIIPKAAFKTLDKNTDYNIKIVGANNLSQIFKAIES